MCFCLIPLEFEDGNQGSINHLFFLFKHAITLWTNTTKNPTPNSDHVLDATEQNMTTKEAQPKNKKYLFFLISQKPV